MSSAYSSYNRPIHNNRKYARRKKRKFFSPEEKAQILSRVKTIGVALAAKEADTWPDVIERWIKDMDKISEAAKAAETDTQETTPEKGSETMETVSTETLKKGKDFTPEERYAIVTKARKVGAKIAAEEAGTIPQVISGWMARGKKRTVKNISIVPGQDGLPAKRDDYHDYTAEERKLLVEKADEVGRVKIQNAYGLMSYTLRDWKRVVARRAGMTETQTATVKKPEELQSTVNAIDIIPGQNGLPEKRATPYTYTHEERRILVAKAAEVGKAKIRKAYGLKDNTLYNWETVIKRQDKKKSANHVSANIPTESPAAAHTVSIDNVSTELHKAPSEVYPPEIEIILLREQVTALTDRIEKLRKTIATLMDALL